MKLLPSFTLLLTLAGLLAGCATSPTPMAEAKPVPANRLLAFQTKSAADSGVLVFVRDQGMLSKFCNFGLKINGVFAARLGEGEFFSAHVPAGEVVMRAGRDPMPTGICDAFGDEDPVQRETLLRPGEVKRFRISIDANGKADIQRAD